MAVFRWRGNGAGTKTAVDDGRNWVDHAGVAYDQATYPGSSGVAGADEVIFDAALATTDASPAAFALVTPLAKLSVMPTYNGTIGAVGAPLEIDAAKVMIQGTAAKGIYLDSGASGITSLTILDGPLVGSITASDVVILKGKVTFKTGSAITTSLLVGYVASQTGDSQVTIESGVTLPSEIKQYGGTVNCQSIVGALTTTGGVWSQNAGNFDTVTIYNGTVLWNGTGYTSEIWIYGGTFDCSNAQTARSIGRVHVHPAGNLDLNTGSETVTIVEYIDHEGGDVRFPVGAKTERYLADVVGDDMDLPYGIEPQTLGASSTVVGAEFMATAGCSIKGYGQVGAGGATGVVAFRLFAASSDAFTDEEEVTQVSVGPAHQVGTFAAEYSELPDGKRWLRVKAENQMTPAVPAAVGCVVSVRTPQ